MKTIESTTAQCGLEPFFSPRSVALIGASQQPGSVGRALLENLTNFSGSFFAVNPSHDFVLDRRTYRSVVDVQVPVDLAVIAVPASAVPDALESCAKAGVPAVIVLAAGYGECGIEGRQRQRALAEQAKAAGIRLLGPNCLGLILPHLKLNASFSAIDALPGDVAILSQSGALCSAILDWSRTDNVGLSALVSLGGMADVGCAELLRWFAGDERTRSILLYLEHVEDGEAFVAAAREAALAKVVVVLRAGRTIGGARAAMTHTGAICADDAVFSAALRRAGVLQVDTLEEWFAAAELLADAPKCQGKRLAIVTNAGGAGALAADALIANGGLMASLSGESLAALGQFLPRAWSRGNPIDVLGDADPARFSRAVGIAVADPLVDGVLAILTPQAMTKPAETASALAALPKRKPLLACIMGGAGVETARAALHQSRIPDFEFPETAAKAFCLQARYSELQRAKGTGLDRSPRDRERLPAAVDLLAGIRQRNRTLLTERESRQFLALNGIASGEICVARTAAQALAAAEAIGFPVALKLHSEALTHKSRAGGVRLGISDAAGVRAAWDSIRDKVSAFYGRNHFLGVTVQRMVPVESAEFLLGARRDPNFGPIVVFGIGGRYTEAQLDHAIDLAPLDIGQALALVDRTRIAGSLNSSEDQPEKLRTALAELVVRFSRLLVNYAELREIEINPLVCSGGKFIPLDARATLVPLHVGYGEHEA